MSIDGNTALHRQLFGIIAAILFLPLQIDGGVTNGENDDDKGSTVEDGKAGLEERDVEGGNMVVCLPY